MKKYFSKLNIVVLAVLFFGVFGFTGSSEAANLYVRAGATGNGADWANALAQLPATLTRGDTYYVADGAYSGYTFDDPSSGSSYSTIKKATISDHGSDIGWQDSYGDGQAAFGALTINMSYIIIDGNSATGSYGISVTQTGGGHGIRIGQSNTVSNVTVQGVTVDMAQATAGVEYRGFYLSSGAYSKTNVLLQNVEVHDSEGDCLTADATDYITMDHFVCRNRRNVGGGVHGDAFELWGVNHGTLRNSKINWNGQQIFFAGNGPYTGWEVYGNIFYGGATAGKAIIIKTASVNIHIYNNVLHGLNMGFSGFTATTTGDAKNNIFYDINSIGWGSVTHSYNASNNGQGLGGANDSTLTSNPFVAIGSNFHLAAPLASAGDSSIGAAYNTDPDGMTRGSGGVWNRGAFEFNVGGTPPPPAPPKPSPPSNLGVN
jgi:hypothetical protein